MKIFKIFVTFHYNSFIFFFCMFLSVHIEIQRFEEKFVHLFLVIMCSDE